MDAESTETNRNDMLQQQTMNQIPTQINSGIEDDGASSPGPSNYSNSANVSSANSTIAEDNIQPSTDEPPSKKIKLDKSSLENSNQLGKIECRLGGILCCSVCLDLPQTAIYQCQNGHILCDPCFMHLLADARLGDWIATCPSCRRQISKETVTRNLVAEMTVSELLRKCQYCANQVPNKSLQRHETFECQERPSNCKYSRIGCQWRGRKHEKEEHEKGCLSPTKPSSEIMAAIKAYDVKISEEMKIYNTLIELLNFDSISFNNIRLCPYLNEDVVFYRSAPFCAFDNVWIVKGCVNNGQRKPYESSERTITYQLVLRTPNISCPMDIHFLALKDPRSDVEVSLQIYEHIFKKDYEKSEYYKLPLADSLDSNRLLSNKVINIRLIMSLQSK